MKEDKQGFTLIELLVVVAIIAILAAILFPVFASSREQAKKSKCSTGMKEIGLAFLAYAQDYNDTLPPSLSYTASDATGVRFRWRGKDRRLTWDMAIMKYTRNAADMFRCPSDNLQDSGGVRRDWGFRSYSMNDAWWAYYAAAKTPKEQCVCRGTALSTVPRSSQYVLLNEWPDKYNYLGGNMYQTIYDIYSPPAPLQMHDFNTSNNYLFYDGHVKLYKYGKVKADFNAYCSQPSNPKPDPDDQYYFNPNPK